MNEFKIGDVVYLKSGSVPMIITYITNEPHGAYCQVVWHDTEGHEQRGRYPALTLTKTDPYTSPPPPNKIGLI